MTIIPAKIKAGLTFSIGPISTAYVAPDWTLALKLRGPNAIDLTATDDGAGPVLRAEATATAEWTAGLYAYSLRATDAAGTVVEVEAGQVQVEPDLAAIGPGHDSRDHVRRTLEAIEAVLEKRATLDQEKYKINNRELWRTPVADLLRLRDRYKAELRMMNAKARGGLFNQRVRVSFGRP